VVLSGKIGNGFPVAAGRSSTTAAIYVDRIPRGEKPSDLPYKHQLNLSFSLTLQPTKFDLTLNVKTAKALAYAISIL
jgi:hypothetical protein